MSRDENPALSSCILSTSKRLPRTLKPADGTPVAGGPSIDSTSFDH
jgi:hypothetical protein